MESPTSMAAQVLELLSTLGAGSEPVVAFAPGRVNLIGAHVDYNLGPVLPIGLNRGTFVAVRARDDDRVRLLSANEGDGGEEELSASSRPRGWAAYPIGMARSLVARGHALPGFDVAVAGDLPVGAGLSSSASLLVACGRALNDRFGLGLDDLGIARAAFEAETRYVGIACGLMDPMACALATPERALYLDCRDGTFIHVPLDRNHLDVMVVDSGTRRSLKDSRFNERVDECRRAVRGLREIGIPVDSLRDATQDQLESVRDRMDATLFRRAWHVVTEIERVLAFKAALARGDVEECGRLITRTHASLREHYEASSEALDFLVDAVVSQDGVLGARLTGAGWGGCVLVLTEAGASEDLGARVGPAYRARFGRDAQFHRVAGANGAER